MSLESATYIDQLVVSNPDGSDPKGQGDDHLRLIKTTLKNTFPNINAAVTVTPAELNSLAGSQTIFRPGMVLMWAGSIGSIPTGFLLCNGVGSTTIGGVPDLRDRFIVGSGGSYAQGSVGGSITHSHSISVAGTALDVSQLPPHSHGSPTGSFIVGGAGAGDTGGGGTLGSVASTASAGSGATHTHGASSSVQDSRPPYFALAYIIKV